MFCGCSSLTDINMSGFNTSRVTNMSGMFDSCTSLTDLNLKNFNTSNVVNMRCMFNGCESATNINISGFDTTKVEDMHKMFANCCRLQQLDISNLNMSSPRIDITAMFKGCSNLKKLIMRPSVSINADTDDMFTGCHEQLVIQTAK